ncbi:MAG TPA: NADH-quinone oxidoreductase subunit L [Acidimicrobiales bacterium]|nr:NADH-quinone oxidoreductase subunit L [Acidimicrobiales bacterium]
MLHLAYLMPALPLAGFVVLASFGRRLGDPVAGWLGTATIVGSFVIACLVTSGLLAQPSGASREVQQNLFTWIAVGGLQVHAALLVDPLSMTMALFVTGVSSLIHLYSIGYMKDDPDFPKFFVYLNLFVASMLILVLANNLLFTFVGWEGVGVCSYWLVAFWFGRDSAASAGKKAFIYNRLADVGFLLAVFLVFDSSGTLNYLGFFAHVGALSHTTVTAICLLLFVAAVGKSAQIPLFPWLADAMEGPTPVSALIHAATMVTAGVYLMCRINPLLAASHVSEVIIATLGAVTALVAATIACAQQDIKKVLAYSTVSQLGYMFLAVGTGAYEAAIFLMVCHAFFKALLFLGAGSVIHGLDDEQDLKRMGNLRRYMVLTFATFAVGWLAISGIPPLSGFWAKGDVLTNAFARYKVLWLIGVATAALTAYYMSRLTSLAFFGTDRWRGHEPAPADSLVGGGARRGDDEGHHADGGGSAHPPHESPWVMVAPLFVLAVLAFFGGLLLLPDSGFPNPLAWIGPVFGQNLYEAHLSVGTQWALAIVDTIVAIVGVTVSMRLWVPRWNIPKLEPVVLLRSYFIDNFYDRVFGRPGEALARFSATVVDVKVIDGAVNGVARLARATGSGLRRVQTGFVRQYAIGIVLGLVGLLAWMITRAW